MKRNFACLVLTLLGVVGSTSGQTIPPEEVRTIAKEAYIYGFPVAYNYRVMHSFFVDRQGKEFKAPWNQIHNEARVFTPTTKRSRRPTPTRHTRKSAPTCGPSRW